MNCSTLENYTLIFIGKLSNDKKKVVKIIAGKIKDKIDYTGISNPRDFYFQSEKQAFHWMKTNRVSRKTHCFVRKQIIVSVGMNNTDIIHSVSTEN